MIERTTLTSVTFTKEFVLREAEGIQPPGTYRVEVVEEPLDTVTFLAYRRVSTTIALPAVGTAALKRQIIPTSAQELEAALLKDVAPSSVDVSS